MRHEAIGALGPLLEIPVVAGGGEGEDENRDEYGRDDDAGIDAALDLGRWRRAGTRRHCEGGEDHHSILTQSYFCPDSPLTRLTDTNLNMLRACGVSQLGGC